MKKKRKKSEKMEKLKNGERFKFVCFGETEM